MPMIPEERGLICECCTQKLDTGDTTTCEDRCYPEHVNELCQFGLERDEAAAVGDYMGVQSFRCFGCGEDVMAHAHALIVLKPQGRR